MSWDIAYHSGMSSDSDMRACIDTGSAIGVVASLLSLGQRMRALPEFMDRGGKVFVDSGAFTARSKGDPMDWEKVYWAYDMLIDRTDSPENLTIVAPDVVGDQPATIRLWQENRERIRSWIEQGARVIMPLQTGTLDASALLELAIEIIGDNRFCAGIPSNLDAMPAEECSRITHHDFHVLGRVVLNDEVKAKLDGIRGRNPSAVITADANWLRARTRKISTFSTMPPSRANGFRTRRTQAVSQLLQQEAY